MQNNVLGLSGSVFAFESKAEALKWAIEFTAGWTSPDERLVRYDQAQELYNFICRNVQLPDTKNASMDDFLSTASCSLAGLKDRLAAMNMETPSTEAEPFGPCCDRDEHGPAPYCEGDPNSVIIGEPDMVGCAEDK